MQQPGEPLRQPGGEERGGMPTYHEVPPQQAFHQQLGSYEERPGQGPEQTPGVSSPQQGQQEGVENWVLFSHLQEHPLVDASRGEKVGEVQDVLLDQQVHRIQAFTYKGGLLQGTDTVAALQATIGVDAVTFMPDTQAGIDTSGMHNLPKASEVIDKQVLTDAGHLLEIVKDLRFEQNTHRLLGIELAPEGSERRRLGERTQLLPPEGIINFGPDVVVVRER